MLARRILPILILLLPLCYSAAQQPHVSLQVLIFAEGEEHPFDGEITVILLDSWGSVEARVPTHDGVAQFMTVPDLHRIQITGPSVEETETEFIIEPSEPSHTERVTVTRKSLAGPKQGKGAVPAVRLHIPKKARKEYEKGKSVEKKDWAQAREHYQKAIEYYADYDLAYNALGVADLRTGDKQAAQLAFSKAVAVNPAFSEAYRNLARTLMAEKNFSEMEQALKKSLNTDPLDPWALTFVSYAEFQMGQYEEALGNARKVHTLPHHGLPDAHLIVGQCLEVLHQPSQALEEYKQYLSEAPHGNNAPFARAAVARLSAAASR